MFKFESSSCQIFSAAHFDQIGLLLKQMAERHAAEPNQFPALWLTDRTLLGLPWKTADLDRFTLIATPSFNALLLGQLVAITDQSADQTSDFATPPQIPLPRYQTNLVFEPQAIARFLHHLDSQADLTTVLPCPLETLCSQLRDNNAQQQAEFALAMAQAIAATPLEAPASAELNYSYPPVCQPVEIALHQQIEKERLLNQVVTQIRQSLDLPVILQTAVEQVRQFLQADRLVIYQLDVRSPLPVLPDGTEANVPDTKDLVSGYGVVSIDRNYVTYEARASAAVSSTLGIAEALCFSENLHLREKYSQGYTLVVEDVEVSYANIPCFLKFLRHLQVQAKLVVPIVVQRKLWGLLIAHQCNQPRQWQQREQEFLRHIAEHLAIAISQVHLYSRLQKQKEILEQSVIERTQDLRDTLLTAQAANRAKSEFLAAMSHELRTPLTSIIGLSNTLLRWVGEQLTLRQRSHLQTIQDSGKHLLELINDILDLSQVEAGKVVLRFGEFSLSSMAQQSLKIVQDEALHNRIELKLDLQIESGCDRFTADARRIRQILINLLSNAIKFTPEGGRIVLRVYADSTMAILQVKDTGIGISDEQRSLLFEKFRQLEPSYNRQYGGAGLGLALTKQLIELHGGSIDVSSKVGIGSVFTVRLPVQPLASRSSSVETDDGIERQIGRIVLIDHQEDTANVICDMLMAANYQLIWMIEGAIALDQIEILEPIIAIINVHVPDTNGYDLIRRLRHNPNTKALKVIALSNTPDDREECIAAGADDYLSEPLQVDQLLQKVDDLLIAAA